MCSVASQNLQQQIVRRLQTVIASLPEQQRPKTVPELREFVQKYSSLITQNTALDLAVSGSVSAQPINKQLPLTTSPSVVPPTAGPSLSVASRTSQSIPSLLNRSMPSGISGAPNLSLPPAPSSSTAPLVSATNQQAQINIVTSQSPSAQVAEHFKSSLAGLATPKVPTVGGVVAAIPSVMPSSSSLSSGGGGGAQTLITGTTTVPTTVHAPVTVQFSNKAATVEKTLQPTGQSSTTPPAASSQAPPIAPPTTASTATTTSSSGSSGPGIQPGVATPLPPGVTLETLGVLCRLPESDLMKLKLPPTLLSAIKFWKARQPPSRSVTRVSTLF